MSETKIPKGYKRTEVGVIPEEWVVSSLGEIADIATGNTPPTRDVENYGNDFPFVSPADLGYGKYISRTEKMLSKKGFSISRHFPEGTILFVCIGSTIGKCGIANVLLSSNQQINVILPSDLFSSEFLYYAVDGVSSKIKALAGEQAVPIVNKTQFSLTSIPFPPLPEQRAIATALSDVDALISGLDQLIAKKRDLKQAAMQQLLTGQKRLPGFQIKSGYKKTEVGLIPEDWDVSSLIKISIDGISNGVFNDPKKVGYGYRLINVLNLYYGFSIETANLSRVELSLANFARNKVKKGDLFFTRSSITPEGIGFCNFCDEESDDITFDGHIMKISPNPKVTFPPFLRLFCISKISRRYLICNAKQTTMTTIGQREIAKLPILLPSLLEQTAIATVLSDMDTELTALEQRRDKTRALKQGMMQELLTGKTRLL